ncbi:MAG: ABC transporter ATP-binding protein [Thermodesulfobacteriota bacterium]
MENQTLIKMTGITKAFPGVLANDHVDFDLRTGEVHTLLGENGAGKTTLMNILSGMYQPDEGEIEVRGQRVHIRTPYDSLKLGLGMVYQHFALIPNLTVLENLVLGFEGGMVLDLKQAARKLKKIAEEYGLSIEAQALVQNLSVGERQRTEIIKTLFHGSEALILDEPTSVLTPLETEDLFRTINSLRKLGKAVVLITHKLHEALAISDRISILKLGRKAAELSGDELRAMGNRAASEKILHIMFGDKPIPECAVVDKAISEEPVLELDQVEVLNSRGAIGLKKATFTIRKGEIFGIAGVDGNGQKSLSEVIAGQRKALSGRIIFQGQDITSLDTTKRFERGISYITDDRISEGCVLDMDLGENAILRSYYQPPYSRLAVINNPVVSEYARKLIRSFNVKATGPEVRAGTLSGGNLQKFILARGLSTKPALIVCNKPTYGLDARTVRYIQELLLEESKQGAAVLLITSDMDELLNYSDRIGVLFNGELLAVMDKCEATPEKIGRLMLGIRD